MTAPADDCRGIEHSSHAGDSAGYRMLFHQRGRQPHHQAPGDEPEPPAEVTLSEAAAAKADPLPAPPAHPPEPTHQIHLEA